jgi:hypothetical protein
MSEDDKTKKYLLPKGYHKGKILNYGIKKNKDGVPYPVIIFGVEHEGILKHAYWQGSFNVGKAREIAIKALLACGLRDATSVALLANGLDSHLLNVHMEVEITVEIDTGQDGTQKPFNRVQWINEMSAQKFKNLISYGDAAALLAGMGIEYDIMMTAKELGIKLDGRAEEKVSDDIPF